MDFEKDWLLKMDAKGGPMETSSQLIANVQFYHDNMVHHESLLQWYRVFFLTFEGAIFAMAFFLARSAPGFHWIPGIFGILGCGLWYLVCTQRRNLVDKQREEIKKLLLGSALERWYDVYWGIKPGERPRIRRLAQNVFNMVLPAAIGVLWFLVIFIPVPVT